MTLYLVLPKFYNLTPQIVLHWHHSSKHRLKPIATPSQFISNHLIQAGIPGIRARIPGSLGALGPWGPPISRSILVLVFVAILVLVLVAITG